MSIHTFLSNLGITKGRKIILKSGAKANLTSETLDFAELGMTNEGELYIGAIDGSNILINSNSTEVLDNHITTVASTVQLGHVKVGDNIEVASGVISINNASTTQKGVVQIVDDLTTNDSTKVLSSAQGYALKQAIDSIGTGGSGGTGGITLADIPDSSMTARGLMTPTQYTKLNGISSGANFTSVENVLTSTSTTSALSAYQGKVLDDKITAHNSRIYTLENSSGSVANIYQSGVTTVATSTAFGNSTEATGKYSLVSGYASKATGDYSTAIGGGALASGSEAIALGSSSEASGVNSFAAHGSKSMGIGSFAVCSGIARADKSFASGSLAQSYGTLSNAFGYFHNIYSYAGMIIGHRGSDNSTSRIAYSVNNNAFIIGNGVDGGASSNAFRVKFDGSVYGLSAFNSSGADYAEYFEWLDGNVHEEDRVGYFVTLDGDKIRKSNSSDSYILGIISANPSVIGDSWQDQWNKRDVTDEWGRPQYHYVDVEYTELDEDGKEVIKTRQDYAPIYNDSYDNSVEYIPREERSEWDAVGMMGKLLVRDDGTCEVNGYCKSNDDGIATTSIEGYRVMKRVSDNIIQVLIK